MEVAASPIRHQIAYSDLLDLECAELAKQGKSMIAEWVRARLKRRETLIKGALLRFLTESEIELTALTKSTALLEYYGLRIAHVVPPAGQGPETFAVFQNDKLAEFINLDAEVNLSTSGCEAA